MSALAKGTMFPPELESQIFSKVKGHSSLAKLSNQDALPFVGKDIFTFALDGKLSIVGENAQKPAGDATVAVKQIRPIKVIYQSRVSDEFVYASEERKLQYLSAFTDGFAKVLGSGLDEMAIHGINPDDRVISATIGTNYFDSQVTNVVSYVPANADTNIDSAVALVEAAEYKSTGIAMSPTLRGAIATLKATSGERLYPDFAFGAVPEKLGGMVLDVNSTVSTQSTIATTTDQGLVGDFQSAFRWGIAKEIPLEVIEYGDPDNTGVDLKGSNQVCLRSEAYVGWAIMDPDAFALINA